MLADQLSSIPLDSAQQACNRFTATHRDILEHMLKQLDSIFTLQASSRALTDETQVAAARQSILDSLHFPQIPERRDHILQAHHGTYQWILEPDLGGKQRWDDFVSWLRASPSRSGVYWVSGKIGAGKSTLLHYIDSSRSLFQHTLPWAEEAAVVRASCFFWNAGNKLQKSTVGLLRTLLTQLFEQTPHLVPIVVHLKKWQTALLGKNHIIDWTEFELKDCLREYILHVTKRKKVFLLVDGLDEFEGSDEAREDLIEFLTALAANENVKLCLSSRRWNIFQDAFESCPKLKLEDLTYNDVCTYIYDQLGGNQRFRRLVQYEKSAAEQLVNDLIVKAAGVFLWVRLVVKQLMNGLRDGDNIRTLRQRVDEIPADLNDYFMRLIDSIEPRNRQEASELFQIALYREQHFGSLHPNYLLDFTFVEEGRPDFALAPSFSFSQLDFADSDAMAFRLESTARKLNSRCMGLLQCYDDGNYVPQLNNFSDSCDDIEFLWSDSQNSEPRDAMELLKGSDILTAAHLTLDFLHRSLRDFLLTPAVQTLLHQYTQGPYDARMFYRNARLVQLVALNRIEAGLPIAIGLASYIFSTLAIPDYRNTLSAAQIATMMRPVIENMVRYERSQQTVGWYIAYIFDTWHSEGNTFLTLSIDFGLESYIRMNLTLQAVKSKTGRPILDYILRPRFIGAGWKICVGNRSPPLEFLHTVLEFGADPNESYLGVSVWALYLCHIADCIESENINSGILEYSTHAGALMIMIQNGAHVLIPRFWLMSGANPRLCGFSKLYHIDQSPEERFKRRFGDTVPAIERKPDVESLYAVSDLLECFRHHFGSSLNSLKAMVMQREAEGLDFIAIAAQDHIETTRS